MPLSNAQNTVTASRRRRTNYHTSDDHYRQVATRIQYEHLYHTLTHRDVGRGGGGGGATPLLLFDFRRQQQQQQLADVIVLAE